MDIFRWWRLTVVNYRNLLTQETFDPYTRPIINGHVDEKTCGNGPQMELQLENDPELEKLEKVSLQILKHGFQIFYRYINIFDHIRKFCLENQKINLGKFRRETGNTYFL